MKKIIMNITLLSVFALGGCGSSEDPNIASTEGTPMASVPINPLPAGERTD